MSGIVGVTNFEEEVNIDKGIQGEDKEEESHEEVDEIQTPSLFDQSPAYEGIKPTWSSTDEMEKFKQHLKYYE